MGALQPWAGLCVPAGCVGLGAALGAGGQRVLAVLPWELGALTQRSPML